jgi:hypothetical protein
MLIGRGAEGLIAIDTRLVHKLPLPVVAVAGHRPISGVTNVTLDHHRAAELSLGHLYDLGHRTIAFMRGQPYSSDSDERWQAIVKVARNLGLSIRPELTIQLDKDLTSPELGYPVIKQLLAHHRSFTALLSFNDIAALGSIRALHDAQLRVPEDVSVVGFDDIKEAAFQTPRLTTIRQPLHQMGELAVQILLEQLRPSSAPAKTPKDMAVEPELIVRESTGPARKRLGKKSSTKAAECERNFTIAVRLFSQTIGVEAITSADEDPLLAVEHVGDRPIGLVRSHFMVPKHITFVGAVDDQVLLIVAGDEQIGRGGKNTWSCRGRALFRFGYSCVQTASPVSGSIAFRTCLASQSYAPVPP